jgi:hypothetical protein
VHEIQSSGRKSMCRGTLRRAALVPVAAVAVLAFAVPAHAGEPVYSPPATPPPAPVAPVEESVPTMPEAVSTVPEATDTELPEMGVAPAASAPPVADPAPSATVEAPVDVAVPEPAEQLPKEPANAGSWIRVRTVHRRPVVRDPEPHHAAISPPRPVTHVQAPVTRRHVHKPARHAARPATSRWYQVPAAQYQRSADQVASLRSKSPPQHAQAGSATDRHAPSGASLPIRGKPPNGPSNCVRKATECVDSCTGNADWKVVRNGSWISGCTSPNATGYSPHEGRDSNSDGQLDRDAWPSTGESGPQYQCPGSQYHHHWCDETETGTETPDEEPATSCPDAAHDEDDSHEEDDSEIDAGDWEKPRDSSCDQPSDTPTTPGGATPPPAGEQGPPAQAPQPPVPPAPPEPAQLPPPPPPTQEPVAAPPAEPSSVPPAEPTSAPPPPDQPPASGTSAPPPAEPAPTPSVPASDAGPKNTRAARTGAKQESHTATRALDRGVPVVQPSSQVVLRASPEGTAAARPSTKPKPAARKPRSAEKPESRQAGGTPPVTRPATDRSAPQRPSATRPVASTSQPSRDWLLLVAMTLFGLSVLAFALAAVSEGDHGTAALTRMRSRLGSKGLSARRVGLNGEDDGAASSSAPDTIRYRD